MSSTTVAVLPKWKGGSALFRFWAHVRTSLFWIVAIGLLLRLGWIVIAQTYRFDSTEANFGFGWEMGRIGAAIASGQGFGNPFGAPTGPTAWESPLYPYLIGGVFRIFGTYSPASAFVLLSLNSLFSALTCIPIFLTARWIFSEKVAIGAAWTWTLLPHVMYWCTRWVWETSLSALLMATIFWLTLALEDRDGLRPWLEFGVLWGITALSSTVLLAFLPASGLWAWHHRAKRGKSSFAGVVLASVLFFACIAPWLVRNYQAFGKFVLIRDNFGAELRLGNGNGADGTWMKHLHPTQDLYALRQYSAMGELAYIAMREQQALDYIRGRALRQRRPGAWLLFWLILFQPAIYYVVFPNQRYRHPIEPAMTILGVYLLTEIGKHKDWDDSSRPERDYEG